MSYKGPFSVAYYTHDMYSNNPTYPKVKYKQIMFEEDAYLRAKGLLRSLKAYHRIYKDKSYDIRTYVVDGHNEIIKELK